MGVVASLASNASSTRKMLPRNLPTSSKSSAWNTRRALVPSSSEPTGDAINSRPFLLYFLPTPMANTSAPLSTLRLLSCFCGDESGRPSVTMITSRCASSLRRPYMPNCSLTLSSAAARFVPFSLGRVYLVNAACAASMSLVKPLTTVSSLLPTSSTCASLLKMTMATRTCFFMSSSFLLFLPPELVVAAALAAPPPPPSSALLPLARLVSSACVQCFSDS
mmetsp:Transcript_48732/g.119318  ORF Transcript_48732/g.119318 Transcript_48732/m.119318 type:complete len:221 (-) Transcript_48732:239-901(-)